MNPHRRPRLPMLCRLVHPASRHGSRGQSLVEFAVMVPIALLLIGASLDLGRGFLGWVNLQNAARIGANYAALHPDADWSDVNDEDRLRYIDLITNDVATTNCALDPVAMPTYDLGKTLGSPVTVALSCQFRFITPLVGSALGNPMAMAASAVFPLRSGQYGDPIPSPSAVPSPPPSPDPTPTPDPEVSPDPSPSPSPDPCIAPNFINQRKSEAQGLWTGAGFTTTVTTMPPHGQDYLIAQQSIVAGQPYNCATTTVTVDN